MMRTPTHVFHATPSPFGEATELLRESLELLESEPSPDLLLPALWAYRQAARDINMANESLAAHFRALYDSAHRWTPGDVIWDLRRERLVATLIDDTIPPSGYLAHG